MLRKEAPTMSTAENQETQNIALKLRLYPTEEQRRYLLKCFGCERFVYNYYLAERNEFYEKSIRPLGDDKEARSAAWKTFRETPLKELKERNPFLKEADSQGVCNAYMSLRGAYQKFYTGKARLPRFHSRKSKNSFKNSMMSPDCLDWNRHTVKVPKAGEISFRNRCVPKWYKNRTKVCSLTFSKTAGGNIYVSVLFEVRAQAHEKSRAIDESQAIGLDFDCDDMYIDSNGKSALRDFGFRKQRQARLKTLSHLQRQLARKARGSKNREKARARLARLEEHIANCRKDWIEKETLRLADSYRLVGLEDLSIRGMMRGSRNAKNYLDISWSAFVSRLERKAQDRDCRVVRVDRFFASSQTCSCCGFRHREVSRRQLESWTCPECGAVHQRDFNAAVNIRREAIRVLREAEESGEKAPERKPPKGTRGVSPAGRLANLALA